MFEQTFKNIDNTLRNDANCETELDYAEQSSWALFLKWLDDYEKDKEAIFRLENKEYNSILEDKYRWSSWANFNNSLTGDDLKKFVDEELFPYLSSFKQKAKNTNTIEYKIGEIFSELKNKLEDGYTLRDLVNDVDSLDFRTNENKHELSALYEERIKRVGNAGRNGGEYYTPRPLIRIIIKVLNPIIGQKMYDGACGSGGFLVEAFNHIKNNKSLTTSELKILQENTLYGKEKKRFPFILGIMNMILHGIESPNISHSNTLEENILEYQESDRYDTILANPPFGGSEKDQIKDGFPFQTSETAFLFLQHFIKILKVGGKAGVIIKNTFLSNDNKPLIKLRKEILEECNLHTILDMPKGTFQGAGAKTVVLFFEKGQKTKKIWYYQPNLDRNLGKKKPLTENDLAEFVKLYDNKKNTLNSWFIDIKDIDKETYYLGVNNPNRKEKIDNRKPIEIIKIIEELNEEEKDIYSSIKKIL